MSKREEGRPSNVFPFTALVAQEQMKLGLVLNAINPKIGGVLIRGEKGTAKSTAVRALASLLPEIEVTPKCPYNCHPGDACPTHHSVLGPESSVLRPVQIIELPVGATEDRVIGSLDIGGALHEGEVRFRPGLLAAANRGILYIDEVNLLNDHLVDVLLDAAAMGRNYVERESISFEHPSQFILVGTMNPEEGDLRPQLLDRFALSVDVHGHMAAEERVEVVKRRMAFEHDPARFRRQWQKYETVERQRILSAQRLLPRVCISDGMLSLIAQLCSDFQVDGLRADIVMCKTAMTLAAYHRRRQVTPEDVRAAAELALPHRRRRQPFQSPEQSQEELERAIRKHTEGGGKREEGRETGDEEDDSGGPNGGHGERVFDIGEPFKVAPIAAPEAGRSATPRLGRRTKTRAETSQGYYVSSRPPTGEPRDVALDATIRAALLREASGDHPLPLSRETGPAGRLHIQSQDIREKVRETRSANFILFAVDASGSMASMNRMVATKGAILSLLLDAYQKRDQVGMIAFRGKGSSLLLPPTNSVDLAERELRHLPTGGRTPLSSALELGHATIKRHSLLHKEVVPLFVLISDGRPNVSSQGGEPLQEALRFGEFFAQDRIHSLVVDTETGGVRLGLARRLAQAMGGHYLRLEELEAGRLASSVRRFLGRPS